MHKFGKIKQIRPTLFIGTNFDIGNALGECSLEFFQHSNLGHNTVIFQYS